MKKIIAKLALFSIVSLILVSISSISAYAGDPAPKDTEPDTSSMAAALAEGLMDITPDDHCIKETKEDGTPGDDAGYIITIIEEPLSLEASTKTTKDKAEFEARICYRNYLSYLPKKGKEEVISILATKCSNVIKNESLTGPDFTKPYNYQVTTSCKPVQVFLSKGGTSLIVGYISFVYKWAASLVGLIGTAVIIISGVQISVAGGDTQAIESAKGRIIKSISGIVILFLSGLILYTINPNFFTQ